MVPKPKESLVQRERGAEKSSNCWFWEGEKEELKELPPRDFLFSLSSPSIRGCEGVPLMQEWLGREGEGEEEGEEGERGVDGLDLRESSQRNRNGREEEEEREGESKGGRKEGRKKGRKKGRE